MFFIKDAYATVWKVEENDTFVKGTLSTKEKTQEEGKSIWSNWNVKYVGKAKEKALSLVERDRIKILSGKITTTLWGRDENKKLYTNVTVFDFEVMDGYVPKTNNQENESGEDSLPFSK